MDSSAVSVDSIEVSGSYSGTDAFYHRNNKTVGISHRTTWFRKRNEGWGKIASTQTNRGNVERQVGIMKVENKKYK